LDVFLDLGFTLVGGPELSPPKMVQQILGLPDESKGVLSDITFCERHTTPQSFIRSLSDAFEILLTPHQEQEIQNYWKRQYSDLFKLDGASNLVFFLRNSGLKVHIVSNLWYPFYQSCQALLPELFDFVATQTLSYGEGVRKPSDEFYRRAIARSGAIVADSMVIGDSITKDILPFVQYRSKGIWFKSRPLDMQSINQKRKVLSKYKNIFEASSLYEVQSIVEGIISNG